MSRLLGFDEWNEDQKREISKAMSRFAKKRWENKTKEEKSSHAKMMAKKRWDKIKKNN